MLFKLLQILSPVFLVILTSTSLGGHLWSDPPNGEISYSSRSWLHRWNFNAFIKLPKFLHWYFLFELNVPINSRNLFFFFNPSKLFALCSKICMNLKITKFMEECHKVTFSCLLMLEGWVSNFKPFGACAATGRQMLCPSFLVPSDILMFSAAQLANTVPQPNCKDMRPTPWGSKPMAGLLS